MAEERLITAIDVGTTKVCTVVGKMNELGEPTVLAYSVVPCQGLTKGVVTDLDETERAIRASIQMVERQTGVTIQSAYVGITGAHIEFINRRDSMQWAGKYGVVTNDDLAMVPQRVASGLKTPGREVIHAIPMTYSLDGNEGIRSPLGMHSDRMEVKTHVVTGASRMVGDLTSAVEGAGVQVESLVLEPLASSLAVLRQAERDASVGLIDIGGGTTDVIVFKNGPVHYTSAISVGGYQFTNDIAYTYDTTYDTAEAIKLKHAHTDPSAVAPMDEISMPVSGRMFELKVPLRDICQLTRERAQEWVQLIRIKLRDAGIKDTSKSRLVMTGGAALLPGLKELVQQSMTPYVRIGAPNGSLNVPGELRSPAFATSTGILLWAAEQEAYGIGQGANGAGINGHNGSNGHNGKNGSGGLISRFARRFMG